MFFRVFGLSIALLCTGAPVLLGADAAKQDARLSFRTDIANENLPWYKPAPGEFPPLDSAHAIAGELVTADFYHRSGQFRVSKTGELMDFTMPAYGSVNYLNAEADLRDVPLGTVFQFFLNQDALGNFTRLATMQDQFTLDAGHGLSYRVDELKLGEGKLLATKHKVAKSGDATKVELLVTPDTRVWKGDKQVKLSDIAVGDELLFNLTAGKTAAGPGYCADIWIGADSQAQATERQRKSFIAFTKARGLPAWIDADSGNKLTVTLFTGDPDHFRETWKSDLAVGNDLRVVVANDELRTWNPPTDGEKSKLLDMKITPVNGYGTTGVQLTISVANMLEGFRKGRVIRIFGPGWACKDPPFGEGLMNYGYGALKTTEIGELTPKEYPAQFPFRTDYGNENLPWFTLKPDQTPPRYSEHVAMGELTKVDAGNRAGQFRMDRTGERVDFTLVDLPSPEKPEKKRGKSPQDAVASVRYLNADATLADVPLGTRCRFHLYQDEKGRFTQATAVSDEFSYLASNGLVYRIESVRLKEGKLRIARQIPQVKNYNGDMEQPPDIGRMELLVNADTRIRKGSVQIKPAELEVGDLLLVNVTSEQPGKPSCCTDIWAGAESQDMATAVQQKKNRK